MVSCRTDGPMSLPTRAESRPAVRTGCRPGARRGQLTVRQALVGSGRWPWRWGLGQLIIGSGFRRSPASDSAEKRPGWLCSMSRLVGRVVSGFVVEVDKRKVDRCRVRHSRDPDLNNLYAPPGGVRRMLPGIGFAASKVCTFSPSTSGGTSAR